MKHGWVRAAQGALLTAALLLLAVCAAFSAPGLMRWGEERCLPALPGEVRGAFCEATADYLSGRAESWRAQEALAPVNIPVSEAFRTHMAQVRRLVGLGRGAGIGCAAIAALLEVLLRHAPANGRAFRLGLLLPWGLLAAVAAWCVVDFNGFWRFFHYTFLPGGVFSSSEPLMALFPQRLFALCGAVTLAAAAAAEAALWAFSRRSERKKAKHEYPK